jgi:hypothetical protein
VSITKETVKLNFVKDIFVYVNFMISVITVSEKQKNCHFVPPLVYRMYNCFLVLVRRCFNITNNTKLQKMNRN